MTRPSASTNPATVLIVEDDLSHARLMRACLRNAGLAPEHAGTRDAAIALLKQAEYDVVLLDVSLPDGNGFEVQQWLVDHALPTPVVFVTSDDLAEHAVQAVRAGAANYVVKRPAYLEQLVEATIEALDTRSDAAGEGGEEPTSAIARKLVGWSPSVAEARKRIAEYARTTHPVLVVGESGTGRSTVSRLIHLVSGDPGPLITVHCRELSERIAREEITAAAALERMHEAAAGGSVILEDMNEASVVLQRALHEVATRPAPSTVRLVLEFEFDPSWDEEAPERFADYLWLDAISSRIDLMPLRERVADIRPIATRELARLARECGSARLSLDDEAWQALEAHRWSGNVSELLACLRTLVASRSAAKSSFDRFDVDAALRQNEGGFRARSQHARREGARLKAALDRHGWNVTATARALDVSRGWLRRRIEWYEL